MEGNSAISLNRIELLTGNNYHVWALKVSAILRAKLLFREIIEADEPPVAQNAESAEGKVRRLWERKNDEAFGIIITTLSDEQAGQFLVESKAKTVWNELKRMHAGNAEDRKIDIGLELKNVNMRGNESVNEYFARVKNIASRSAALGYPMSDREIVYHLVRGVHPKLEKAAMVLRPQRSATLEQVRQTLNEEEERLQNSENKQENNNGGYNEKAYKVTKGHRFKQEKYTGCFICGKKKSYSKSMLLSTWKGRQRWR